MAGGAKRGQRNEDLVGLRVGPRHPQILADHHRAPHSGLLKLSPPFSGMDFRVYLLSLSFTPSICLPDTFSSHIKSGTLAFGLGLIKFSICLYLPSPFSKMYFCDKNVPSSMVLFSAVEQYLACGEMQKKTDKMKVRFSITFRGVSELHSVTCRDPRGPTGLSLLPYL